MDDRFETVDSTAACLPRHFGKAAAAPECESKRRTRGEGEYRCECGVEGRTRGGEKSSCFSSSQRTMPLTYMRCEAHLGPRFAG